MVDIEVAIERARDEYRRARLTRRPLGELVGVEPPVRHVNPGSDTNFDWRDWEKITYWLEEIAREHRE